MSDLYQEIILEEYRHPHNFGKLENAQIEWKERNSSCGDEFTVFLQLDDEKKRIIQMSWIGSGCAISVAAVSLLSEHIKNLSVEEILALSKSDLESLLGIEEIAYGREKCLLLGLQAVQKSLRKNEKYV